MLQIRGWVARASVLALLVGTSVVAANGISVGPAQAAANCHFNTEGLGYYAEVQSSGATGDMRYPAILHGETIKLYTHTSDGSVRAEVTTGMNSGDLLSIDRSNFLVSGSAEYYFRDTSWVAARGTWDYCERSSSSIAGVDGAHRYVRVCLRRSGALQCANKWYGDNDDETGDISVAPR